ncbi:hypothetical protein [Streptomyces sp. NPDC102264]|uniref:hypothetical protein n=1 Tax=Streptomyces sp. NPDC102264 TaxID=3366149 RepID=UPI0037FB4FF0
MSQPEPEPRTAAAQPADRAALRNRLAETLATADGRHWRAGVDFTDLSATTVQHYWGLADAVLAVLPEPADQGADQTAEIERLRTEHATWRKLGRRNLEQARATTQRVCEWVTSDVVTARSEFGNGYREAQRDIRDIVTPTTTQPGPVSEDGPSVDLTREQRSCGSRVRHPRHQVMRMDVVSQCPGVGRGPTTGQAEDGAQQQ